MDCSTVMFFIPTAFALALRLCRSFRQGLLFCALLVAVVPSPAQETPQCRGYRYAFIREVGTRVQVHACKRILEPSSRPVDCQMLGEIETAEVREKLKSKTYSYVAGYSLGLACSLSGYFASKVSIQVGGLFAAYNYGAQHASVEKMQDEVRRGERALGQSPDPGSHVQSAGRSLCSYLAGASNSWFATGTRHAVGHIASMSMDAEAMHADAKLIWSAPPEQRAAMFEEYQRNIQKRQERRSRMIEQSGSVLNEIVEYAMSNELSNVPFGTDDSLAVVPANSCIPAVDLVRATQALRTFPKRVDELLQRLDANQSD